MIEGLAGAAEVAENSGNAGGLEKTNFDTKEPQDFSGKNDSYDNGSTGEIDFSNDSSKADNNVLDSSQSQDYSRDDKNDVSENLKDEDKELIRKQAEADNSEENNETENRMEPQVEISFKCPEGCDPVEYERQLKQQEEGLNNQSVAENMANREAYEKRKEETGKGRDPEGNNAQKEARDKALQDKIAEYQEQGMSYSEAEEKAQEWLGTQAALHNPDQVAGGNPSDVQGVGDSNVNSSIGRQWANKVGILKDACDSYAEGKTPEELANTKMNVKLIMEV